MSRIEKLTPEQQARLPEFRAEWFRIGTSTERADRAKAEAAILAMRQEIGVTTRPVFIWCDSPVTSLMALQVIGSPEWKKLIDKDLGGSLGGSLRASLGASLWASLWASLGGSLRASLGGSLRASLWASLRGSLRASLWASLGGSLGASSITGRLGQEWWGQHEAYWVAFYLFCRDILGVEYDAKRSKQLDMWRDVAQSCCWWWCYENYVVISERPTVVSMNAQERLHSSSGPCLAFADGWALYQWNGATVPKDVILEPEKLTVACIDAEANAEVRRVMLERFGEERYLSDSGAKPVHEDACGILYRRDFEGDEPLTMVRVINSTAEPDGTFKIYWLRVPPDMKTALEAVAWTFDLKPSEYQPSVET